MQRLQERSGLLPFDIMFNDMFNANNSYQSMKHVKYPMSVIEQKTKNGIRQLLFKIVVLDTPKELINVEISSNVLSVIKLKKETPDNGIKKISTIVDNIVERPFEFNWKISADFDMYEIDVSLKNGLLQIIIPEKETVKAKKIEINT